MDRQRPHYEVVKKIISRHSRPYLKENIKAEICREIGGEDYASVVIDYLWGAYVTFDAGAKAAFAEIFAGDLKAQHPAAFYFFSFYFSHSFQRSGFDRRSYEDRRNAYALDFFNDRIKERRRGIERRQEKEKRLNWTRVSGWASVPFKIGLREGLRFPEHVEEAGVEDINVILSGLVKYYEEHIEPGETDWLNTLDHHLFSRARSVMKALIDITDTGEGAAITEKGEKVSPLRRGDNPPKTSEGEE